MVKKTKIPDLWLLILIVGLPLISETFYTPTLPNIARSLLTSDSMVEYTLTIYFLGFALGMLFWGQLSDKYGRKPSLISGLLIYILGCISCFFSPTITYLMISRFIQAFGCSTGAVLGEAICRDSFKNTELGKAFSIIGSTLSFGVAIGPALGGLITQSFGWAAIFICLVLIGFALLMLVMLKLPETYVPIAFSLGTIKETFITMISDKKVLAFGFLAGACNGLSFSYYAEGPFYLINMLGLSPSIYGLSYLLFAFSGMLGGYISKKSHDFKMSFFSILNTGKIVILCGAFLFLLFTIIFYLLSAGKSFFIYLTLASMTIIMTGVAIMIPNILSLALVDYKNATGIASSLLGFYYYMVIASFTFIMGFLHNGTLFPMPAYFLGIAMAIFFVCRYLNKMMESQHI